MKSWVRPEDPVLGQLPSPLILDWECNIDLQLDRGTIVITPKKVAPRMDDSVEGTQKLPPTMFCGEIKFIDHIEDGPNGSLVVTFKAQFLPLSIQVADPIYREDLEQLRHQSTHHCVSSKS